MLNNKPKHLPRKGWYDGWIYSTFIDQESNPIRAQVLEFLEPGSSILDVGCATGNFAIMLAKKGFRVTGIDISHDMISVARKRQARLGIENLEFIHSNAAYLNEHSANRFQYALFSFSIHEIGYEERLELIETIKPLTKHIIFCDYQTPPPRSILGFLVWGIEFLAGSEHFLNFKDFVDRGGLNSLIKTCGLKILNEKTNRSGIYRIMVCD